MFATLEGTVDQARERRREARRCELRSLCEQEARIKQRRHADRARGRRRRAIGRRRAAPRARSGWRRSRAATTAAPRGSRAPATRCASLPALDHALSSGRADARPGRSRRRVRDARERCAAGARRGRQGAERDRAGGAHARPARRWRTTRRSYERRSLSMTWTRGRRELASAAACRSSRAPPSSRPSGTSPSPSAPPTSRPAPCSSGSSQPPTRSSPRPPRPAQPTAA